MTLLIPITPTRRETGLFRRLTFLCCVVVFGLGLRAGAEEVLPAGNAVRALDADHFPSIAHAVIWRNWFLVEPEVIAKTLGAEAGLVRECAAAMGLPLDREIQPEWERRGYITVLRRNWHLLPYEQLITMVNRTPEVLALALREDDFLFIKLGGGKPGRPRVTLPERTAEIRERERAVSEVVRETLGDVWPLASDPPFSFVERLSEVSAADVPEREPAENAEPRIIYSYFAAFGDPLMDASLDPYPDGLLQKLAAEGVTGVWLHVVLRQLAPGGEAFPEWGAGHETRLANLRDLVARAERYGIRVYLYLNEPRAMPFAFYADRPDMAGAVMGDHQSLCLAHPVARKWLEDSVAHVFREVAGLGGVISISGSENQTHCGSHGLQASCPRCAVREADELYADVNKIIADGIHREAPEARVFVWDWGWNQHGDASGVIDRLPTDVWLLSVSEWAAPFSRGGIEGRVGEYSLSVPGPGPRAKAHWAKAREKGLRVAAKVQLNITWEFASIPWLPVGDLVARHAAGLAKEKINGLLLSWSLGGHPSPNLRIAARLLESDGESEEEGETVIREVISARYGEVAAPAVREAWKAFSEAFSEYPYDGSTVYQGPQHMGPANLLYPAPTGLRATMVGMPYDDLERWRGAYPAEVFLGQWDKLATGWEAGLNHLERAVALLSGQPESAEHLAVLREDQRLAKAAGLHFASVANQVRWVLARDRFLAAASDAQRDELRPELLSLLQTHQKHAKALFLLVLDESRLGFEASNHYFFTGHDLIESIIAARFAESVFR